MSYDVHTRKNVLSVSLLLLLFITIVGCAGEIRTVDLPTNMTPFNDNAKKLHFQLPPGWQKVPLDREIDRVSSGISWWAPVEFRKGDRGMFAIWCDQYDSNRTSSLQMYDAIDKYAPQNKPAGIYFEVDSPGSGYLSRPTVVGRTATHVAKGEKKEFLIITVIKTPPVTQMHKECEYMLFGRSASSEYNEEIKADITAIAATLNNSGDYK
jgi:hypothetical protein